MATSEPLPQRPTRKSRRLRGQEPQQATPEKVVGSVATPPFGSSPLAGNTPLSTSLYHGVTHVTIVAWPSPAFAFMLFFISHDIITAFAYIFRIMYLCSLTLSFLHPITPKMFLLLLQSARMCSEGTVVGLVCLLVCLSMLVVSLFLLQTTQCTLYLTHNKGVKICGIFPETAPLQSQSLSSIVWLLCESAILSACAFCDHMFCSRHNRQRTKVKRLCGFL